MLIMEIVLTARVMTTKLAQNKTGKKTLTMRKQGYAIIGIGLAALAGIFWLSQLSKQEEIPTAAKPPASSQETTVDSETEKPIDHFAGMRRQSSSEIEPLSEEDKAREAEVEAYWKKRAAYQNSPRGNYLERHQDEEDISDFIKGEIAEYKALNAEGKAIADLDDWIFRQQDRRESAHHNAMFEEVERTGNINLLRPQDLPNSTATIAEAKAGVSLDVPFSNHYQGYE